jgi:hypothetical protein
MQSENLQAADHLENLGIDASVILKRILNVVLGVDRIFLTEDGVW